MMGQSMISASTTEPSSVKFKPFAMIMGRSPLPYGQSERRTGDHGRTGYSALAETELGFDREADIDS